MIIAIIIFFILLIIIPDIWLWRRYIRNTSSAVLKIVWWLPSLFSLVFLCLWFAGFFSNLLIKIFFSIVLALAFPKGIFMLFSLAGLCAGRRVRRALNIAGAALAAVVCLCALYGLTFGTRRLEVREVTLTFANLPEAFDGYRIVHISDLHVGTFGGDNAYLERLVERVNALDADAILFTGDIINTKPSELPPHAAVLSRLEARDGVWSVLGNHDYCEYARYETEEETAAARMQVIGTERQMGWRLLLNENGMVERDGERIAIIGVENTSRPPYPSYGDLKKARNGIPEDMFTVLMTHDPTHWRREVLPGKGADLTLSGHTHAMQFEVLGFSPSSWTYAEWGGVYREGGVMLNVSKGAGGTIPFRFGAWPEVTVLTLRREGCGS